MLIKTKQKIDLEAIHKNWVPKNHPRQSDIEKFRLIQSLVTGGKKIK